MLRDQGKLSLDDTLEKFFPEYTIGKNIMLKDLLSMCSGIVPGLFFMDEDPEKYAGNTRDENLDPRGKKPEIAQGAGDIVSTAEDMDLWVKALRSGQVVSKASFREMTTCHTAQLGGNYGYGLAEFRDGWFHDGSNGDYTSFNYFNEEYDFQLFIAGGNDTLYQKGTTDNAFLQLLNAFFNAVEPVA